LSKNVKIHHQAHKIHHIRHLPSGPSSTNPKKFREKKKQDMVKNTKSNPIKKKQESALILLNNLSNVASFASRSFHKSPKLMKKSNKQ
jgi:hypothetical protein